MRSGSMKPGFPYRVLRRPILNLGRAAIVAWALVQFSVGAACARAGEVPDAKPTPSPPFGNPEMVQILGYDDNQGNSNNAMEPFISRDGNYLFFNNSNTATDTNLFWATRIDDVTFQFQGEIGGVNSTSLDAVASMDANDQFYFITTRSYFNKHAGRLATIYSGPFLSGNVATVGPVKGVASPAVGLVDFDAEISADGNTLYFTQGDFFTSSLDSTKMMFATRKGDHFAVSPNSASIMAKINDRYFNYAPDTSASELEFFFTRTNPKVGPAIFVATRASKSKPFGTPQQIEAITGFAEAPSISPDDQSLYYHVKNASGVFVINRVTRTLPP